MSRETLLESARRLQGAPAVALEEFAARRERLVVRVNEALLARDDLVGRGNRRMMRDNHANHAQFVESILTRMNPDVLVDTVLWVFRTYRSRGFRPAYWEAQLDAWVQALQAELTPGAFAAVKPLYDWLLHNLPAFTALTDEAARPGATGALTVDADRQEPGAVWAPLLLQGLDAAELLLSALFDDHGRLLWANRGMSQLVDECGSVAEPAALLVNPDLNRLLAARVSTEPVFEGVVTVGDGYRINRSLRATAWRLAQGVLLFAEPNAHELDQANAELSRLNQRANNLQRELIKYTHQLEQVLAAQQRSEEHYRNIVSQVKTAALLSNREREVITLVAQGKRSKEIRRIMDISHRTVDTYRKRLMDKLGLRTLADLVCYAVRTGIVS